MSTDLRHRGVPAAMQQYQHPGMTESDRQTWGNANVKEENPRRTPSLTVTPICTADETDSKELEIHRCLTANVVGSNQEVDLIHLRKLAESPGGLKSMAIRRLAWPKLVAAHQVLWNGPPMASEQQQPLAANSREIHRLVQRTKWSKYQITKSPKTFDELLGLVLKTDVNHLPTPRQSFADLSEGASDSVNANSTGTPTHRIRRVSFDLDIPLDDVEEPSHRQLVQMAQDERQLLRKLLFHIYRCHPDAPIYDGLQNLIAVLWIVIESPSLTSITSLQLIQYQWLPQSPNLFMQLLSIWDPALHKHFCLQENSHTPPHCIANSWIPHWFSNDLKDLDVLLRIWDVFIVNPPITIVYFSVALVVHFRDSLLRAKQQPIFQAILHHLPSDGLEKYDMVEPILQRCLQALQDYPPDLIIDSASLPPIPEWVLHSTAPTDTQVIQRLADLRQGMAAEPNPVLPILDVIQLQPTPSMRTSTTDISLTPPNDESYPWQESPDATPCSTPESVRSVRTMFHAMETPKLPARDVLSINWVYKIGTVCWVSMVVAAVAYSLVTHSSHKGVAICTHEDDRAPLNVTANTFSSDDMNHSMTTVPAAAPVPCPFEESRATSTPNYVNLACPDNFQITAEIPDAQSLNPSPALDADMMTLLQEYGGDMCHPILEFISHLQCEDSFLSDSLLSTLSPLAFSVPPEESNTAWLVEFMTDRSTTGTTGPIQMPETRAHGEEMLQLGAVLNATLVGFVPSHVALDHVDSMSRNTEQSAAPRKSDEPHQPKLTVKPTRSSLWSNPKHLVLGIGNFLMKSTEAHLRGRREANTLLVNNVQRFVRNQANGINPILDNNNVRRDEHDSKSPKQENHRPNLVKVVRKKGMAAIALALEATAVRLDASRSARAKTSQLAATVARRSKVMTEDGVGRVYGHLLATSNRTRNSVGLTTRAIARTGNRLAHQISFVATHKGSKFLRSLQDGLNSKNRNNGRARQSWMHGFPLLLKQGDSIVVKDYTPSSKTAVELLTSSIVRHSGTVLHAVVSLLSQGGTTILRELARFWDQLAPSLPQLRTLLSSGIHVMEEKGMLIALLVALYIKEGVSRMYQIGTVTGKGLGSLNDILPRLSSSAEKLSFDSMPRALVSASHFVAEMVNRLRENMQSIVPSMPNELRKIMHYVAHAIVDVSVFLGELGLHVVDIIEDTAASIGEMSLATVVSALKAGKRTYRGLENGGRNMLLASQFAWNCILVYLTLTLSVARQKIVHIGVHNGVDTSGNTTDGSLNEHLKLEGAIVAADGVLAFADGNHAFQDRSPQASMFANVTKKPPGRNHLYSSLVEVQPVEVINWAKVRPTLRRSRGAADVARDALLKKSNRNVSIVRPLGLEEDFRMMGKATLQQSRKLLVRTFSQESRPNLTESQQRIQEIGDRTKKVLAHVTAVVGKSSSHFLDNLALRFHYLQSILGMLVKNHRDRMGTFRRASLNLTLREAEHSVRLVSFNTFFVMITLIEVGKKEMLHSSERQITAVRHVYKASWRGIEKAAALRKDNISIIYEMFVGTVAKVKGLLSRKRSYEW